MGSFIMILFSCLICFIKPLLLRFRENQRCSCFIKTLCWIANKLYCIMIFGYFIRNILEMSQFILISSINEVYDSNTENAYRLTSFIYSVLMILIFILIAILIIYLTFSSYKLDHSKHNKLEEIFRGLQQDKKHRLYVSLLLLRRLIFVILLVTCMKISSRTLTIILTIIQALYTICLSYLRPYKETKGNIIEILNEIYFGFLILFLTFTNTEDEWNSVKTSIYMWVLVTNTFIVFIIVLAYSIVNIFKLIRSKCRKSEVNRDVVVNITPKQPKNNDEHLRSKMNRNQKAGLNFGNLASNHLVEETKSNANLNLSNVH